jgi:ribosomal protein L11 methyltransferase
MTNYLSIKIPSSLQWQKDILVAQLAGIGFEGFEEEAHAITAFIPENLFDAAAFEATLQPLALPFTKNIIPPSNWNAAWEANYSPVVVDNFCTISASFHPAPATATTKYNIIITPKMSFGTGHHATTYLMIKAMEALYFKNKKVLDIGTGTGVLAILASQCGATSVMAIDNDEWSINNATENISENKALGIVLCKNDSLNTTNIFDIILANINRAYLLQFMKEIEQHLATNGVVLFSGLLMADETVVVEKATQAGLKCIEKYERNDWICLKMSKIDLF